MNRRTKEMQSNAGINSALQGGGRPKVKSFGQKPWMLPQPVLIIDTYDKSGKPNAMNAAWGGQWDAKEIMIAMGAHATTENLNNCPDFTVAFATKQTMVASDYVGIVSVKNEAKKMAKTGWKCTCPNTIVTVVALYDEPQVLLQKYDRNLTLKTGCVDGCDCEDVLKLIAEGKIDTVPLITHRYLLAKMQKSMNSSSRNGMW